MVVLCDEAEMYVETSRLIVNSMIIQNVDAFETDDVLLSKK